MGAQLPRREKRYAILLGAVIVGTAGILWFTLQGGDPAPEPPSTPPESTESTDEAPAHRLAGRVVDVADDPVAGATVTATDPTDDTRTQQATADADGVFSFATVPAGDYVLDAGAPGFVSPGPAAEGAASPSRGLKVTLGEGGAVDGLRLVLGRPGTLQGRVVAGGVAVADAVIGLSYLHAEGVGGPLEPYTLSDVARTAQDGSFRVQGVAPGRLRVLAQAAGFAAGESRDLGLDDGGSRDGIVLDLAPGLTWSGTVRSKAGQPLRAEVVLSGAGLSRSLSARTDGEGRFRLDRVPTGAFAVQVRAPGHRTLAEPTLAIGPKEPLTRDFILEPATGLVGRVVDPNREPVPQAAVRVVRGGVERWLSTDASGAFQWDDPDSVGAHTIVQAVTTRHAPSAEQVAQPGEVVELQLGAGGFLSGRVVDSAGAPVTQFALAIDSAVVDGPDPFGPRGVPPLRVAQSDGTFRLGPVRPGRYDLRAEAANFAPGFAKGHSVASGGSAEGIVITLGAGATVRGRITARDGGTAVGNARVLLFEPESAMPPRTAMTAADGTFAINGVGAGRRSIRVTHAEYLTELASGIVVPAQGEVHRDVALGRAAPGERFSFHGIGATLKKSERGIEVANLMEGSPAQQFGLQAGDVIRAVDRESTSDLPLGQVVERIRGEAGVPVALEIDRPGQGRFTIRVERGRVVVKDGG